MKTLALILITFSLTAQIKVNEKVTIPSDALHFYGTVAICELSYGIQNLILKDQKPHNKFLICIGTAATIGVGKEIFDKHKANPTGFDKNDLATDAWAILCWIPFRICLNDFKQVGFIPRMKKDKYYLARDL